MAISDARAIYGLSALGTNSRTGVVGSALIGETQSQLRLTNATVAYVVRAIFAGEGDELVLNLLTGDATGSTAWVDGVPQVEVATITAAGGCTSNGTMTMVLTAMGLAGSPKNVAVALTTTAHTTADLIAAAARAALEADADIAAMFAIGGTGSAIYLTRKPSNEFIEGATTVSLYNADDATLNLAIPGGLGVTAAASSYNAQAGVLTTGTKIFGDGVDFEGNDLVPMGAPHGIQFAGNFGYVKYSDGLDESGFIGSYATPENRIIACAGGMDLETFTFTAQNSADLTITVVGAIVGE